MNIVNVTKNERVLINEVKIKILSSDKDLKYLSTSDAVLIALKKFNQNGSN